jgi:hypothetical protein
MNNNLPKAIDIIEERGSFLLICNGSRFAVVERRNGSIYPMTPGEREGVPITPAGMEMLIEAEGWLPKRKARRLFNDLSERGERLAQSLR